MNSGDPVAPVKVFVSSPGNLRPERLLVARICRRIGHSLGVPIVPLLWEGGGDVEPNVSAFPPSVTGEGPQAVIDRQVWNELGGYDVYLGMIWHRMGTPTGGYRSGTEAEYRSAVRWHREFGRPSSILFYRKTTAVSPVDIDPEQLDAYQFARGSYIAQADHGSTAIVADEYKEYKYEYAPPRPVDADTLEVARGHLQELQLDEVPAPAPLPHGSRMLISPNPLFVGRDDELKTLAESLKAGNTTAIGTVATAAATGMGGIGKTQLASEFVHRYGQYFSGGVFWLSFADASAIPAEIAACGGAGGKELGSDFGILDLEGRVRRVMSMWQSEIPRLLVFDNCEDEALLEQWRPPTGGCRVLVTSRRKRWDLTLAVKTLPLDVLRRKESIELLREHRPDLPAEDPNLDAIGHELGDLPLALQLAGSYLARYRFVVTAAAYLEQLRRPDLLRHRSLQLARATSPTKREQGVSRAFALSYERLDTDDKTDQLAVKLLARAAFFAPGEPIPRDLLRSMLDLSDDDSDALLEAEDALDRLTGLGLLETEQAGAMRMHRLLATFAREVVVDAEAQTAAEMTLLDRVGNLLEDEYPAPLLVLLPHLRAVTDGAKQREDKRAALLCVYLGSYLRMIGEYAEARPYLERALDIRKKVLGEEHTATVSTLNDLALLLWDQGEYERARSLLKRALTFHEKVLGEEHPLTASNLNNLALLLLSQGEYQGAYPLHERALEIHKKVLGEEHPATATSLNNLAALLWKQREYEEARPLAERALEIRDRVLGEEHPATAISVDNLAVLLWDQGSHEDVRPLFERALEIRRKVLGEEHPSTATSLNNLALLLRDQGEYEEARPLLERALAIREKVLGEEHPYTAHSLNNLAGLLRTQGQYEDARPLYERALTIAEKALGAEHPDTKQIRQNLADLLA